MALIFAIGVPTRGLALRPPATMQSSIRSELRADLREPDEIAAGLIRISVNLRILEQTKLKRIFSRQWIEDRLDEIDEYGEVMDGINTRKYNVIDAERLNRLIRDNRVTILVMKDRLYARDNELVEPDSRSEIRKILDRWIPERSA